MTSTSVATDNGAARFSKVHYSSERDDWATPMWLIRELESEGRRFVLDVCARADNAKAAHYIRPQEDSLSIGWGQRLAQASAEVWQEEWRRGMIDSAPHYAWMNPPYGKAEQPCKATCTKQACARRGYHIEQRRPGIEDWMKKAHEEAQKGVKIMALVPNRPAQWWKGVLIKKDRKTGLWSLRYRLDYYANRIVFEGAASGAPFPSMLVYFDRDEPPATYWREAKNR